MSHSLERLIRYFFAGGLAAVVDLTIFAVFTLWLGYNYLVVAGVGFVLATAVNYWLCIRFIFESGVRFGPQAEVTGVFMVSGVGLLMHEAFLYVFVEYLVVPMFLAKIAVIGMVFFWNFSARNFYVFARPSRAEKSAP